MKPVDQTIFAPPQYDGKTFGNCVQACVASILELPLNLVPHCVHLKQLGGSRDLAALGYGIIKTGVLEQLKGYHIMAGFGPREQLGMDGQHSFPLGHAVVGFNGEMVHDPHPSRQGLKITDEYWWFIHLTPNVVRDVVAVSNAQADEFTKKCQVLPEQMLKPYSV